MNELRKSLKKGLPIAIFLIFLIGCGENFDRFTAYPPGGDISQFSETVQTLSEDYTISAENGGFFVTNHRTIVHIPENVFVYADGSPVSGQVDIEFLEIYNKGLLVMYNVPTISNGQLLISDGVFNITARQGGEELLLAAGKKLRFQVPDETPNPEMIIFYGDNDGPNQDFNWTPATQDGTATWVRASISEWAFQDSTNQWFDFGYEFFIDQLTWINVDIFKDIPEGERTDVCVELPEIYTNTNTQVFMIFRDINGVLAMLGNAETMLFCEPYSLTPIGYDVTFVVISHQGDEIFHFGMADATIEANHHEFIVPAEKSLQEILDILAMF
jgi:hypothetical protein